MIVEASEEVITLSGALTQPFWESVETAIALALKRHPSGVIVDCSNITQITEEGANTFQYAIDYVVSHDARIIFAAIPDAVMDVLRATPHVKSQLATAPTVQEARESLDRLDQSIDEKKAKRLSESVKSRHILAVVSPHECQEHFIHQVEQLVSTSPSHLVFLLPIVVPRELPLQAPVPEAENKMCQCGDRLRDVFAKGDNLTEIRLERTRDIPTLVAEVADEIGAEQVLVAVDANPTLADEAGKTVAALMAKVNRPLMFIRGAATIAS